MIIVTKTKNIFRFFWTIQLFFIAAGYGQSTDYGTLNVMIDAEQLVVECHFKNLISNEMMDELSSGLSRNLSFNFSVLDESKKMLLQKSRSVFLRYNVWEGIYTLKSGKINRTFKHSDYFKKYLNDSLTFNVATLAALPKVKSMQIIMIFSADDIAASQKDKLDSWLKQSESSEKSISDQENRSGFSINLSGLISLFLDDKQDKNQTIYKSEFFTIQSLK
jgi:hypothetical protein